MLSLYDRQGLILIGSFINKGGGMIKKCCKCGEEKELEGFGKKQLGKYGVTSYCKSCTLKMYSIDKESLSDNYIIGLLIKNNSLKRKDVPLKLIRLKRIDMMTKRKGLVPERAEFDVLLHLDKINQGLCEEGK
jgi:hypothetical protein